MDQENLLKIYLEIFSKIEAIRKLNVSGTEKIQNVTKDSIQQFSSLINRIDGTTAKAKDIMNLMREKVSLEIVKNVVGKKTDHNPKEIREKYEEMFKELNNELSLITHQKTEDISRFSHIQEKITALSEITEPEDMKNAYKAIFEYISAAMKSASDAIDAKASFIHSVLFLLQDIVLTLVDSFIQINSILENTLGESSTIGNEINAIVTNLQCEDICQETCQMTIEMIASIRKNLLELKVGGISEKDINQQF